MATLDLPEVLRLHKLWLADDPAGVRANLRGANLRGADLSWANLRGADLSWANLREANLSGADLREANLSGANLSWANLREANLRNITLCGATIDGAAVRDCDIGGPGHILCALTDEEWETIKAGRTNEEKPPCQPETPSQSPTTSSESS
jgi:hypothetical protein